MSEHHNQQDPPRRIRFSHDDEVMFPQAEPQPPYAAPYPAHPAYTNPFLDSRPPSIAHQTQLPPPTSSPYSGHAASSSPANHVYDGFSAHLGVARPPVAQTVGSGLPGSGITRQGFAASTPPYPASNSPSFARPPYGSTSEETLVGEPTPPLKPALRRSSTEENLRLQAAREAAGIVNSHLDGRPQQQHQYLAPPPHQHQQRQQGGPRADHDSWGGDEEAGHWHTEQRAAAGILSNLLRLYGDGNGLAGMNMHRGGDNRSDGSRSSTGSYYGSWEREQDLRRRNRPRGEADEGAFRRSSGGKDDNQRRMQRDPSSWTVGTSLDDKVLEPEDPRPKKAREMNEGEEHEEAEKAKEAHKEAAKKGDELAALDAAEHRDAVEGKAMKKSKYKKYKRTSEITAHVATLLQKQEFILKLAKALMTFGAPSHRLESQLNATAAVLNVNAQFIHVPSVVIASFGDSGTHTSETKFIKASGGLNLGALHKVHEIYREVVHDEMGVEEGVINLDRILKAKPIYNVWIRIALAGTCAGIIAPMGFAGSFVDAFAAAAFGSLLAFLNLFVARRNAIFSNIFEISVAALISFAARGLSTTGYFCYESVASAGVVMVLPGYVVLCGSLELASKNLIAGSVRMVYAIIYTLFLGFSIAVGSDVFYLFDPSARGHSNDPTTTTTILGSFVGSNSTTTWEGQFTFTDAVGGIVDATQASLQKGSVMCLREPGWEWWRQGISIYWLILLVPVYSTLSSLANMQPFRSRELPVMVFIAVVGYVANRAATTFIFERSDIVSFIGATVIGLLGNLYSRVFNGTSFTAMATGVLFLVPGGIAAAGGLAMSSGGSDSYNSGLMIGFRMVQVAIGITIGLFFSSFLVYSFGSRKGGGLGFAF
ncbi:hypothetical protein JCM8547_005663 [Rhodosporidiobolus lusitaniae]